MAATARSPLRPLFLIPFLLLSISSPAAAEIRTAELRSDDRPVIPFDEFGSTQNGVLELDVTGIALSGGINPLPPSSLSKLGFFLSTREAWFQVLQQLEDGEITCALQSRLVKTVFILDKLDAGAASFSIVFNQSDSGQFTLLFADCLDGVRVSMTVRSAMYNLDGSGRRSYLSVGSTALPRIYSFLCLVYASLAAIWIAVLCRSAGEVLRIHHFMLAVVVLKAANLLCEAEDKSHVERTGGAHGWDVLFYAFSLLKGVTLFTLIVLIGTGWSFLKPYLHGRDKRVLMVVIPLQVVANAAQVELDESGPFDRGWVAWRQVFLLVDVVCCCAVLFPIVWSIKNLRDAARTDGKAAVNLMKLTLFRQYYVVVISYVYFTRIVVYALATVTSYRYLWTGVVAGEVATLAFYVFTGYKFRPEVRNPYFAAGDEEDDEAAAVALKQLDDEFEL